MNDSQLLNGLRQQDPAAVRHLSECWMPSVWRFVCVRVGGDKHLAEDIVSETVLALIRAVAVPDNEIENPGAWLRAVASRKVNDHFRAAARVKHLIDQVQQTVETVELDGPACRQEREERREAIRGVMNQLSEPHRLALEWKYIDRLCVRDIAARLDLTEKAVESLLFRARREFKERLERLERHTDEAPQAVSTTPPDGGQPGHNRSREPSESRTAPGEDDCETAEPGDDAVERATVQSELGCDAATGGRR